ncbi:hypothetical protein QZM19_02845 [Burkholderia multivorans]|uniref:hypothetical protein n=1 Tax=Burkholderia multivorans TaxID=87883 RepID=UPI002158C290|nr:hypothetical protein [Burkholderia multivorans]MDN7862320.1 hypothetical protein [Burkholderia multivorans]
MKNRTRIVVSNWALAYDSALEPIRAVEAGIEGEITAANAEGHRRRHSYAVSVSI